MEMKNLLRQIARKSFPYLLSVGIFLGSVSYAQDEIQLDEDDVGYLNDARNSFNKGIEDGFLSEEEQRLILGNYEKISGDLPAKDKQLFYLLRENTNGWDFGKPNLEKYLDNVKVESIFSKEEHAYFQVGLVILMGSGLLYYGKRKD